MASELRVTLNDDGSVSTDATRMKGSSAEIIQELEALAKEFDAAVEVEKHLERAHHHHHDHGEEKVRGKV